MLSWGALSRPLPAKRAARTRTSWNCSRILRSSRSRRVMESWLLGEIDRTPEELIAFADPDPAQSGGAARRRPPGGSGPKEGNLRLNLTIARARGINNENQTKALTGKSKRARKQREKLAGEKLRETPAERGPRAPDRTACLSRLRRFPPVTGRRQAIARRQSAGEDPEIRWYRGLFSPP